MNKLIFAVFAAGLSVSTANAAPLAVPADGRITAGAGGNCVLLSEDVRLNLSSNVVAALNCDEATNTVSVGTCHNAGSRNSSLTCAQIGQNADGDAIFNHADCDAEAVSEGTVITGAADFRGFFAQTSGGSVAPAFLGGNCSAQVLTAHGNLSPN